jgi:hypothetical protein
MAPLKPWGRRLSHHHQVVVEVPLHTRLPLTPLEEEECCMNMGLGSPVISTCPVEAMGCFAKTKSQYMRKRQTDLGLYKFIRDLKREVCIGKIFLPQGRRKGFIC